MARAKGFFIKKPLLCLPPSSGDLPTEGGIIIASPALPERKKIEHAGHCYQKRLIRTFAVNHPDSQGDTTNSESDTKSVENDSNSKPDQERLGSSDAAKSLASKMAVGSDDLYELLELGDKRWHATADNIKKNFRRISLTYHPDKIAHQGEQARQNSETHFKAVMKAYDILSDKKKRAAYDSIDDVDDSIPSEKDATSSPERFYEKFGSCFAINARWSVSNRVPDLGNDDTDIETVDRFYDFWYSFKSWRDFSFDLEYNVDQAESREEKRWMDRQNAKHIKAKKLEENTRIRRLVDLAYKHDPRLKRVKQEAKAKKDAAKQERVRQAEEAARIAKEETERKRIESERLAAEDKIRRQEAKKQKDAARQVLRKARQKLRAVAVELGLMSFDKGMVSIENMCSEGTASSIEALTLFLSSLSADSSNRETIAQYAVDEALKNPQLPICSNQISQNFAQNGKKEEDEEAAKDVSDTANSLENNANVTESTENSEADSSQSAAKTPDSNGIEDKPWTREELSFLSKGVAKYPGGTRDRWIRLSQFIGTRTPDEVLQMVNSSRPSKLKGSSGGRPTTAAKNDSRAFDRFQEKKKGKPVVPRGNSASSVNGQPAQQVNRVSQPPNKLQFTPKQQQLFEGALKKYPSTQGDQRWKLVSAAVGRTPEHCQQRFNELIAYYRSKKASS